MSLTDGSSEDEVFIKDGKPRRGSGREQALRGESASERGGLIIGIGKDVASDVLLLRLLDGNSSAFCSVETTTDVIIKIPN